MYEEGNEQGTPPSVEEPLPPPEGTILSSPKKIYESISRIIRAYDSLHFFAPLINTKADENILILRIHILEEPLTAQTLSTTISAITDLHARCFFIQQNRLADLMDYAQSRDPRYLKEVNLRIGILSHNSPAIIDFLISSVGGVAGAATLVGQLAIA